MKRLLFSALVMALFFASPCFAQSKYRITGRIAGAEKPTSMLLLSKSGGIVRQELKTPRFNFTNLSASAMRGAKLYFFKDGSPLGPGVFQESKGVKFLTLTNKAPTSAKNLTLNFTLKNGYLLNRAKISAPWLGKQKVRNATFAGASLGFLGVAGSSRRPTAPIQVRADENDVAADSDTDGVPDILDVDDNNNGITDERDTGGGSMISSLYVDLARTVNAHLGNLNETTISNTLAGENVFNLTLFVGLRDAFAAGTGGHVVCDPSQVICRSAADGGTTSIYSGVSESNNSLRGQLWSNLNGDGSGKPNLEVISLGGSSDRVLVGSIQPRSAAFNAGDLITANVTGGGRTIGSQVYSILPPVISSPMLVSYNVGGGDVSVDYTSSTTPGTNLGNPIVLTGNSISLNFFPPQRRAIVGVETDGAFRDIGSSKLGILIGGSGINREFTCAGFYSGLSSGITELGSSETRPGGAVYADQGAILWPLYDATPDTVTTSGGQKSFTVDLANCLARAGFSSGTYLATLIYAGTDTRFGASRSGQNLYITIPSPS